MADESQPARSAWPRAARDIGVWVLMMTGGAFIPGLVMALIVIVILVIAHLAG